MRSDNECLVAERPKRRRRERHLNSPVLPVWAQRKPGPPNIELRRNASTVERNILAYNGGTGGFGLSVLELTVRVKYLAIQVFAITGLQRFAFD